MSAVYRSNLSSARIYTRITIPEVVGAAATGRTAQWTIIGIAIVAVVAVFAGVSVNARAVAVASVAISFIATVVHSGATSRSDVDTERLCRGSRATKS